MTLRMAAGALLPIEPPIALVCVRNRNVTAYVVLKLSYASSDDLSASSDMDRAFPKLPTPPFVFQRQSAAIDRACALAKELPRHETDTVEFMVLETKQAFRALPNVPASPATLPDFEPDDSLATALLLALGDED